MAPRGSPPAEVGDRFQYSFAVDGTLHEAGSMAESTSPFWWLNSGGLLIIQDGAGYTVQGALPDADRWRKAYAASSPEDTDEGAHPQNLFRLISRSSWGDARVEATFRVLRDNRSASPNRNESNGLLLMSRYQDSDDLYYAGLRADGHAVIKKKYRGTYYTLAEGPVFEGAYDRGAGTNLIPHDAALRLRAETANEAGGVRIRLSMRREGEEEWQELLSFLDEGAGGVSPIASPGKIGIRTDFMDVEFKDFLAESL
jgi:hypothetical protein